MEKEQALYHRDEFRTARANASKDAEAYDEVIYALERLGSVLTPENEGLNSYEQKIVDLCLSSPIPEEIPAAQEDWHIPVKRLYCMVREARNDAFHQGAVARHLTNHAIELAIILEDALTQLADAKFIRDFMVRGPVCASLWQPLSFVRQQMLVGSFSYLPMRGEKGWCFLSDSEVARYLSSTSSGNQRNKRLAHTVQEAITNGMPTQEAIILRADDFTDKFFELSANAPALVCRQDEEDIIGIITAYDLL